MSRIEEALKRVQSYGRVPNGRGAGNTRFAVPARKKFTIEGKKHHVPQDGLMRDGLLAPLKQASKVGDEFRRIKRPLIGNAIDDGPDAAEGRNLIMIASGLPGAGKTFCSVNLAVSISLERELNVLLVDVDVAKPHITRAFGLEGAPGLIDLLVDETADVADVLVRTDLNDIQVLPAGKSHPQATELLASERMSQIVKELSSRYSDRIVLLDSPPLLITTEAQALAMQVGQIALIVEAGETSKQSLQQAIDILDPGKAVNLVLNKARSWGRSGYYHGEYAYAYESG